MCQISRGEKLEPEAGLLCGERWREGVSTGAAPLRSCRSDLGLCEPTLLRIMVLCLSFQKLTHYLTTRREELGCYLVNSV